MTGFSKGKALSIREMQSFHAALDKEKGFDTDILRNIAFLSGEIGEVVRAIQDMDKAESTKKKSKLKETVGEELADCLAYILKIANYTGVDLGKAYSAKMQRNLSRYWRDEN